MKLLASLAIMAVLSQVHSFTGSSDKFLKKYAMMKIYESCFGEDVLKQIRNEVKQACAKCASLHAPLVPTTTTTTTTPPPPPKNVPLVPLPQEDGLAPNSVYHTQPAFDAEKLHQAILAFRPNAMPQPSFRPYGPASFYNPPFANPGYPAPGPMFYPGFQQVPFSPYSFPLLGQQQYMGSRVARGMDLQSHGDMLLAHKMIKFSNASCVLQELGYLDENLEPNYARISEKIGNLPVREELRRDMQKGVTFCQKFAQCVPEMNGDKHHFLSRELMRPMFFFKCYKHKKLQACIMKDLRERYEKRNNEEHEGVMEDDDDEEDEDDVQLTEDTDDLINNRRGKHMKLPGNKKETDELAASIYEFLYTDGDGDFDIDGFF